MGTNAMTIADFGDALAGAYIDTTASGLDSFTQAAVENGWQDQMLAALAGILVAFAVVWGVWLIAKKLYRGAKAVK